MAVVHFLAAFLVVGVVLGSPSQLFDLELNDDWILFKTAFNKTYENNEHELSRRLIWEDNLRYIQQHNLEYDLGKHTYITGLNQFADLTLEEFRSIYLPNKFSVEEDKDALTYMPPLNAGVEGVAVDWRRQGYVTGVKNQGQCGSCWSFSTTGSLEGQWRRKTNRLISLSEQQLVDCSTNFGNHGCQGGLMSRAVAYITAVGGIELEASYPYRAQQGICKFSKAFVRAQTRGYFNIPQSEAALQSAVAHIGPISIAIDANHRSFQLYRSGVYYEPACSSFALDHAVLVVGYGTDSMNRPYWIVKNSWATTWGNGGYIYMAKDRNNQCGVATLAGYPLV